MSTAPNDLGGLTVPLNRSEYSYAALGGVACTINQVYQIRFDSPLGEEQARAAARRLVSAQPRLRGVVEPGWLGWRFRILADDAVVDQLFDLAFRVVRGVDTESIEALEAFGTAMLNEPFTMERGLGVRFSFLPHPQRPVLVLTVEHTLGDGRSMMMWVHGLIRLINGMPIPDEGKVDSPSMVAAIAPRKLLQWPRAAWSAWQYARADKQRRAGRALCTLDTQVLPRITAHAVRYGGLSSGADVIKAAAKKTGASINTFLLTAISEVMLRRREGDANALASIRLSVDLRPYFEKEAQPNLGNYVASFYVHVTPGDRADHIKSIDAQMRDALGRFERHEMLLPWLPNELVPMIGRRLYAALALKMRLADRISPMSCHFTTVGDLSWLNPKGATIRMQDFYPMVSSSGPVFATSSFQGRQILMVGYQRDRTTREAIDRFIAEVDAQVAAMVAASGVLDEAGAGAASPVPSQATPATSATPATPATPAASSAHAA